MNGPIDREKVMDCERVNVKLLAYEARRGAEMYLINRMLLDDIRRSYLHSSIDYETMLRLVTASKAGKAEQAEKGFKTLVRV